MKTVLTLWSAMLVLAPAHAQLFRPEALNGALFGGLAGAVIGHNSGDLRHNAWKGAAIGAAAGLVLGEAVGTTRAARPATSVVASHHYIYRESPVTYTGFRRGYRFPSHYYVPYRGSHYSHGYYRGYGHGYPSYRHYGYYGSNAARGLWLGALAGGIIGHNSGDLRHEAWRGAVWGAGAGWLLGTIADANRRVVVDEMPVAASSVPASSTPAAASSPSPVTIINNYYNSSSPMSSVNSLFGRN